MKYDFETVLAYRSGASKWDSMYKIDPETAKENIVPLSLADMEFRNAPEIIEAFQRYLDSGPVMGYTAPTEEYYASVINFMKERHHWNIEKDWISLTNSAVEALKRAVANLTEPGDGVLIFTPVYYPFYSAIEDNRRNVVRCPLILNNNKYEIDYDDFKRKAKVKSTTCVIFCNPHNPVGRVWSRDELSQVAQICLDNSLKIISDDIHFDFIREGSKHTLITDLGKDIAEITVTCTSASKSFNLAGLKTSNIIIPNKDLKKKFEANSISLVNIFGYLGTMVAYNDGRGWLDECVKTIYDNAAYFENYVRTELKEIDVVIPEGTYLEWLDMRRLGLDRRGLTDLMRQKAKLFVDEGYLFGQEGEGFQRINIACPKSVVADALDRLKAAIRSLK